MEFCPDCGGMMLPFEEEIIIEEDNKEDNVDESAEVENGDTDKSKDSEESEDEKKAEVIIKKYLKCNSCGYMKDLSDDVKEAKIEAKIESEDNVIMRGDESGMRSTVKEKCPKCGHDRASYELIQTRSADEAPTRFFTCEKCHHKWRGYD